MENTEIIKALRCCASLDTPCKGLCSYHGVEYCLSKKDLDAADALEAADKRIEELEKQAEHTDQVDAVIFAVYSNQKARIAELEAQIPKWISVEDRLPEESGEYIVYIQMGTGVEVPDFFGSNDLSYVTSMYFKERQKLWLDEYDEAYNADLSLVDTANDYHVTHWMPLPQKPKGEQE